MIAPRNSNAPTNTTPTIVNELAGIAKLSALFTCVHMYATFKQSDSARPQCSSFKEYSTPDQHELSSSIFVISADNFARDVKYSMNGLSLISRQP